MPKQVPPLTQLQLRNATAKDKPYKPADGGGLYLEVMPSGGKLWRMGVSGRLPRGRAGEARRSASVAGRRYGSGPRAFKHAIRCGLVERNPAEFLREVLQPGEKRHVAAIGAEGLPEFLRALMPTRRAWSCRPASR